MFLVDANGNPMQALSKKKSDRLSLYLAKLLSMFQNEYFLCSYVLRPKPNVESYIYSTSSGIDDVSGVGFYSNRKSAFIDLRIDVTLNVSTDPSRAYIKEIEKLVVVIDTSVYEVSTLKDLDEIQKEMQNL